MSRRWKPISQQQTKGIVTIKSNRERCTDVHRRSVHRCSGPGYHQIKRITHLEVFITRRKTKVRIDSFANLPAYVPPGQTMGSMRKGLKFELKDIFFFLGKKNEMAHEVSSKEGYNVFLLIKKEANYSIQVQWNQI